MKDITYCFNPDCPYRDCEESARQLEGQSGEASFANFGGVCRRYISYLVSKGEDK